jgi:3-oxoacyl-[acyl-carrier-protein] synthase III
VRIMVSSAERALDRAGLTVADVNLFVPHQANTRIIASARAKLGIAEEHTVDILATTGNTSAASIPMALADAAAAGRLQSGDIALLIGFGAGMSWASAVLEWAG